MYINNALKKKKTQISHLLVNVIINQIEPATNIGYLKRAHDVMTFYRKQN